MNVAWQTAVCSTPGYVACFLDPTRTLLTDLTSTGVRGTTVDDCVSFCLQSSYLLAGIEVGEVYAPEDFGQNTEGYIEQADLSLS